MAGGRRPSSTRAGSGPRLSARRLDLVGALVDLRDLAGVLPVQPLVHIRPLPSRNVVAVGGRWYDLILWRSPATMVSHAGLSDLHVILEHVF